MKLCLSRFLTMILPIVTLLNVEAWAQPTLLHAHTDSDNSPSIIYPRAPLRPAPDQLHTPTPTQYFAAFLQIFDSVLLSRNLHGLVHAAKKYCEQWCTSESELRWLHIDDACSKVPALQREYEQMWTLAHSIRAQVVRRQTAPSADDEKWAPPPPTLDSTVTPPPPNFFSGIFKGLCYWEKPHDGSDSHQSNVGMEWVLSETLEISAETTEPLVHEIQNAGRTFSVRLDDMCIVAYRG